MNYAQVYYADTANGPGCRTSVFVSGCTHHCKGCFNACAWDFGYGKPFTESVQDELIRETDRTYVKGFTFLGGEPMEPANQKALRPFLERIRRELPGKTIWLYSGYTWEQLTDPENASCHTEDTDAILSMVDVLVDGEFVEAKYDVRLKYRGSSNQRIIDVRNSHVMDL